MLRRQTVSHWRSCCALLLSAFTLCGAGEGKPDGHATELALTNSTPAFEAKGTLNQTNAPASTSSETNATPSEVDAKAAATDKVLADFIAGQKGQRDLTSTNTAAQAHAHSPAPLEAIPTDNLHEKPAAQVSTSELQLKQWQTELANARQFRTEQNFKQAISVLIPLLEGQAPDEIKRPALFELGLAAHQGKQLSKAQQIFSLYVSRYPEDPTVPEVLLRQGVIYRQMGVNTLALSKFYGVLSSALALKLDRFEHYQRVVLQAQTEIADSYFIEAQYREAADFFSRLLKLDAPDLNKARIHFKLIQCLHYTQQHNEAIGQGHDFLRRYPGSAEEPEVRFLLVSALKQVGRTREALQQVMLLLSSQQGKAAENPENWIYWQQRTGNEIANQLYKEGDYVNALEIYFNLSNLDKSPAWQLPVWYQIGLVFERLKQPEKAGETYGKILDRQLETGTNAPAALKTVFDMARWRKDFLKWQFNAEQINASVGRTQEASPPSNSSTTQ